MRYVKIDPIDFPILTSEHWWIIHPNTRNVEFKIPSGAVTACTNDFLEFKRGIVYRIVSQDKNNGWVSVADKETIVEMPEYLFARNFDAEIFIRGIKEDFDTPRKNRSMEPISIPSVWTDSGSNFAPPSYIITVASTEEE